jgi:hypothetical protein
MDRLENNIEAGDSVVDIAGFSRGAALALSFANEIADKMKNLDIRYIGLWDVVGEFGLPGEHVNAGHNLHMPPNAHNVFHAMALDETRLLFPLTRLSGSGTRDRRRLQEVWFRGVHSDVGGGNNNPTLNGIALNWLFQNAKRCGLPIRESDVLANIAAIAKPGKLSSHKIDAEVRRRIRDTDLLHSSVVIEAGDRFNNPGVDLSRIDDLGAITKPGRGSQLDLKSRTGVKPVCQILRATRVLCGSRMIGSGSTGGIHDEQGRRGCGTHPDVASASRVCAAGRNRSCERGGSRLEEILSAPDKGVPEAIIEKAQAVVVIPSTVKARCSSARSAAKA